MCLYNPDTSHVNVYRLHTTISYTRLQSERASCKRSETIISLADLNNNSVVDLQAEDITEEESQLLDADHWYRLDGVHQMQRAIQNDRDEGLKYYHCVMGVVRQAYLSTRKTQGDIVEVLKDVTAREALFHFAFCLRRLKEFSLCLREIRTSLSMKANLDGGRSADVQTEGAVSSNPKEMDNSEGNGCPICFLKHKERTAFASQTELLNNVEKFILSAEEGIIKLLDQQNEDPDNISKKIYHILLILKEILTLMEIYPEGDQKNMETFADKIGKVTSAEKVCLHDAEEVKALGGCSKMEKEEARFHRLVEGYFKSFLKKLNTKGFKKRYFVDERSAELMDVVKSCVSKLNNEINQEESLLIELIDRVCESYAGDTEEYKHSLAVEEQRMILTGDLRNHLSRSTTCLCIANQEIYMAFRNLIELIDPGVKIGVWQPRSRKWFR
ncbi:hypothetical protein FRX31_022325 [Thalictrum thalictroides]|uniref:Uncharacterized protein n=1 Tax=Thalictrum thalictroides TaxID=46969 RepID=A0A7J6VU27_THATH|nr:hypothetical protein FRX31_022325 [Thalictrum thalictroides]